MSNSPSQPAKADTRKPVVAKAIAKTKPEASASVDAKPPVAAKAAKVAAPAKAKAIEPVVDAIVPAASNAPVKAKQGKESKGSKEKKSATKKPKLVRDSFTFPEPDYAKIGVLKQRALKAGREVKKSELLRAGLAALSDLSDAALLQALGGIDKLKPGRPAK